MLDGGAHHVGRRVLVATGVRDRLPDLPGLAEQWGTGAAVCPYCDGWEVRDRRIAVLASGPMSVHQAQLLRQLSPHVTYFVDGTELPADAHAGLVARGIAVNPGRWCECSPTNTAGSAASEWPTASTFRSTRSSCTRCWCRTTTYLARSGLRPPNTRESSGSPSTPRVAATVPGLWAAGNVVSPRTSVPIAAGAGNAVGAMINADLVEEDVRRAVAASGASAA